MKHLNKYWADFFFFEIIGIVLLFQQEFKPQMVVFLLASILLAAPALLLKKSLGQAMSVFPLLILSFFGLCCSFFCQLICESPGEKKSFGVGD